MTKAEAGYVDYAVDFATRTQSCQECSMWQAWGACSLVEGSIRPQGICRYFEKRTDARKR